MTRARPCLVLDLDRVRRASAGETQIAALRDDAGAAAWRQITLDRHVAADRSLTRDATKLRPVVEGEGVVVGKIQRGAGHAGEGAVNGHIA